MTPGQGFLKQSIMVLCILNPEKDDEVNIDISQNVRYDFGTRTRWDFTTTTCAVDVNFSMCSYKEEW